MVKEEVRWYVAVIQRTHTGEYARKLLRAYNAADARAQTETMRDEELRSPSSVPFNLIRIESYEPDMHTDHAELREREESILRGDMLW